MSRLVLLLHGPDMLVLVLEAARFRAINSVINSPATTSTFLPCVLITSHVPVLSRRCASHLNIAGLLEGGILCHRKTINDCRLPAHLRSGCGWTECIAVSAAL